MEGVWRLAGGFRAGTFKCLILGTMIYRVNRLELDTPRFEPCKDGTVQSSRRQTALVSLDAKGAPKEVPLGCAPKEVPLGCAPQEVPLGCAPKEVPLGCAPKEVPLGCAPQEVPLGCAPQG